MKTAHRTASHAKRAIRSGAGTSAPLPKFWRPKLDQAQKLDCQLIHWDLIERFTTGAADRGDLWDWMETGLTYHRLMQLLEQDGTDFTPEAMHAVTEQLAIYEAVIERFTRTGRAGFNAAELLTARAAAAVFDSLVEMDRHGLAQQAARWSVAQMQGIVRSAERA